MLEPASPEDDAILHAQQAERRRIAQLLHDTVAQSLTGTYLQAASVARTLHKGANASVEAEVARLAEMLRHVVFEMRDVIRELTLDKEKPPDSAENR